MTPRLSCLVLVGNWISSLSFDSTGRFLAVGYNCGQVVVLKQQPDEQTYQLYTEFKSHDSEFDFLTSMEIEEKINAIRWFPFPQRDTQRLLTTNGAYLDSTSNFDLFCSPMSHSKLAVEAAG